MGKRRLSYACDMRPGTEELEVIGAHACRIRSPMLMEASARSQGKKLTGADYKPTKNISLEFAVSGRLGRGGILLAVPAPLVL